MDLIDISISIDTLEDLTVKQLDKIVNLWSAKSGCELDSGGLNYAAAKRKVFYLENMNIYQISYFVCFDLKFRDICKYNIDL